MAARIGRAGDLSPGRQSSQSAPGATVNSHSNDAADAVAPARGDLVQTQPRGPSAMTYTVRETAAKPERAVSNSTSAGTLQRLSAMVLIVLPLVGLVWGDCLGLGRRSQ